ncbi:hypothetical protein LINGRAHAP2_LOCUS11171 [Linum grandiflorum]
MDPTSPRDRMDSIEVFITVFGI